MFLSQEVIEIIVSLADPTVWPITAAINWGWRAATKEVVGRAIAGSAKIHHALEPWDSINPSTMMIFHCAIIPLHSAWIAPKNIPFDDTISGQVILGCVMRCLDNEYIDAGFNYVDSLLGKSISASKRHNQIMQRIKYIPMCIHKIIRGIMHRPQLVLAITKVAYSAIGRSKIGYRSHLKSLILFGDTPMSNPKWRLIWLKQICAEMELSDSPTLLDVLLMKKAAAAATDIDITLNEKTYNRLAEAIRYKNSADTAAAAELLCFAYAAHSARSNPVVSLRSPTRDSHCA